MSESLRQRSVWRFIGRLILAEELFVFIWRTGTRPAGKPMQPHWVKLWASLLYGAAYGYGDTDHW